VDIFVRSLDRGDVDAAIELLIDGTLYPSAEDAGNPEAYWNAALETRQRDGDVLVADADGLVVGVIQVIVFPHFQHTGGWCAEIESVHVRDGWRSRGVGAELLAAAEEIARARECYRIQLTSRTMRVEAHRFYLANGYELTSQGFKKYLDD